MQEISFYNQMILVTVRYNRVRYKKTERLNLVGKLESLIAALQVLAIQDYFNLRDVFVILVRFFVSLDS